MWDSAYSDYSAGSGEPPATDGKASAPENRMVGQFMRETAAAVKEASAKVSSFWKDAFSGKSDWSAPPPAVGPAGGGGSQPPNAFVCKGGEVSVDIKPSASGYDNKIYWSDDNFKTKHEVGIDNKTGTVKLGTFPPGTKIQFGIDNGHGDFFVQGTADSNSDKQVHAQTDHQGDGSMSVGFEDLRGGGDHDFNDAVINVREAPQRRVADHDFNDAGSNVREALQRGVGDRDFNDAVINAREALQRGVGDRDFNDAAVINVREAPQAKA